MRGNDTLQGAMFSYLSPEQRVPADHPLRPIRQMVDTVLKRLSPRFEAMYAEGGRPSIPPEKLLRALLLQCLYSVRSVRLLMEQLDYNLLFRWFVGLNMDDAIWDCSVFAKNRERLLEADVASAFFAEVGLSARGQGLLSDEHFTVDGTLIEAWAGQKSFQPKTGTPPPTDSDAGNPEVNFRGQKRTNDTHASTTDPDARSVQEGERARGEIGFSRPRAHGESPRPGGGDTTDPGDRNGGARGVAGDDREKAKTEARATHPGGDKNYDTREQVASLRALKVTPTWRKIPNGRGQCTGPTHHPPCGLRREPDQTQAGGRNLWLVQDRGPDAQDALPRLGTGWAGCSLGPRRPIIWCA